MKRATGDPFTVVVCGECEAESTIPVLEYLRASVRRCHHGMLVSTACILGRLTCAARPCGPGSLVVLQPCSVERVPVGPAHWVGPVNDDDAAAELCAWTESGGWNIDALPSRLRTSNWLDPFNRRN